MRIAAVLVAAMTVTLGAYPASRSSTDGVQHSDGAAVTTQPLGPRFPHGLFAVHDGENTPGDGDREGTNFKLVRLEKLPQS